MALWKRYLGLQLLVLSNAHLNNYHHDDMFFPKWLLKSSLKLLEISQQPFSVKIKKGPFFFTIQIMQFWGIGVNKLHLE